MRIAYAGAPLSGKTATMKALMPILRGQSSGELVYSPLEARGRTLYFDWAEYQGGSFRDGQLKCQITSVPGQESLRRRRNLLIADADVVVFVIDSRPDQMEVNRKSLAEIRPWLERDGLAPIEIVYQCNKRDLPGTLGMEQIRSELALGPDAELYESSAVQGDGIRIAFVAAVRFGIRQAELLRAENRLPIGTPEIESGEQLLDRVRQADGPGSGFVESDSEPESTAGREPEREPAAEAPPAVARPAVMPMADWLANHQGPTQAPIEDRKPPEIAATVPAAPVAEPPPITEALATPVIIPAVPPLALPSPWLPGGEAGVIESWPSAVWEVVRHSVDPSLDPPKATKDTLQGRIGGGWHARSSGVFGNLDEARAQYQEMADWLVRLGEAVSAQRCLVLTRSDEGWRAWQMVRELPTLGMLLRQGLEPGLPSRKTVQILTRISTEFVSTCRKFAGRDVQLPLLLRTLAQESGRTVYSGFLPKAPIQVKEVDALTQLENELRPLAKAHLMGALNIPETLIELEQLSKKSPEFLPIVELLQSLLIGE